MPLTGVSKKGSVKDSFRGSFVGSTGKHQARAKQMGFRVSSFGFRVFLGFGFRV